MQTFSRLAGKITQKWNFFDIFVFNNVKSGLKIILYQPNKVVFNVKVLRFVTSIPIPKAPMGRGWADVYTVKVFTTDYYSIFYR